MIDLPGVNAQEKSREELLESLRIGAQEMLDLEVPFEAEALAEGGSVAHYLFAFLLTSVFCILLFVSLGFTDP